MNLVNVGKFLLDVVVVEVVAVVEGLVVAVVVGVVVAVAVVDVVGHALFSPEVSVWTPAKSLKASEPTDQLLPLHSIATTLLLFDASFNRRNPNDSKNG